MSSSRGPGDTLTLSMNGAKDGLPFGGLDGRGLGLSVSFCFFGISMALAGREGADVGNLEGILEGIPEGMNLSSTRGIVFNGDVSFSSRGRNPSRIGMSTLKFAASNSSPVRLESQRIAASTPHPPNASVIIESYTKAESLNGSVVVKKSSGSFAA